MYFQFGLVVCHMICCSPITTPSLIETTPIPETETVENRSISDMMLKQTETVKKIVSEQAKHQEYPVITKFDAEHKEINNKEMDKMSLEELRIKCQHFAKFFNTSRLQDTRPPLPQKNDFQIGYRPIMFEQKKRPVYVPPTPPHSPRFPATRPGFYITTQATTTAKPVTTPTPVTSNVKYIRLEPVILQKTILSDGRTVYYWHKSLPSAVAYPAAQTAMQTQKPSTESSIEEEVVETTEQPHTTTGSYYNRYDIRNFFAFYRSPSTTTEKSTTTTTTTTSKPNVGPLFQNQLRFVVPVPYDSQNGGPVKSTWGFDEFAYYPKDLQPSTVNVQVPYSPSFHVIKALAVPNKYAVTQNFKDENLDDVTV